MRELSVRSPGTAANSSGGHQSILSADGPGGASGGVSGADGALLAAPLVGAGAGDVASYDDEVAVPSLLSRDSSQRVLSNSFAFSGASPRASSGGTSPVSPDGGFGRQGGTGGGGAATTADARSDDAICASDPSTATPAFAAATADDPARKEQQAPAGDRRRSSSRASALKVRALRTPSILILHYYAFVLLV